jgi:hypothetical protein
MIAYDFPLLSAFWTILVFFAVLAVFFVVIWCFVDNFRRRDHSGWAKAGWTILILFLPILGALVYILARPAEPSLD